MKLKELNDELEKVVTASLNELSKEYTKQQNATNEGGGTYIFDFWHNPRMLDKDKNQVFTGVMDVRVELNGKVISFKRLLDRQIIQRKNIGTIEQPKYGKQENYELSRNAVLRELLGKGVTTLALGLSMRAKEEIEDFNRNLVTPATIEESFILTEKEE